MVDIRKLFPGQTDEQILNEVRFKGTMQEFFEITTEPDGSSHFTYPKKVQKETFANE